MKKSKSLRKRERFYTLNVGVPGDEPVFYNCAAMTRRDHTEAKRFDPPNHPGLLRWRKDYGGEIVRVTLTVERVRLRARLRQPSRRRSRSATRAGR